MDLSQKAWISWSGGKDAALALYRLQQQSVPVHCLCTNLNAAQDRIAMHGVRRSLLEAQAAAIGLPLRTVLLPEMPSMAAYETEMDRQLQALKTEGYGTAVFGDIFLEDLRRYREAQLARHSMAALFPLWAQNSRSVVEECIDVGFKAIVVCVDDSRLPPEFCGRTIDAAFLADLPADVDPCGERGEYHSFVFDGPIFQQPVAFAPGNRVYRQYPAPARAADECFVSEPKKEAGFYFLDLNPSKP